MITHSPSLSIDLRSFRSVTTDSRKVLPGDLFVAIKGEVYDGHTFITTALEKGAHGILFSPSSITSSLASLKERYPQVQWFEVNDTLHAYRSLAHQWRQNFKIPVIAILGSVGKTTTKEFTAALLSGCFKNVLKTQGSQNGFVGIPMTLFELNSQHDCAVVEIGIDAPEAMKQHIECVQPTHAVLTALGPEHLEQLIDIETVTREETLGLILTLKQGGDILINTDDPLILNWWANYQTTLSTTELKRCHVVSPKTLQLETPDFQSLRSPLPGQHNQSNLILAQQLAQLLGLSFTDCQQGLLNFKAAPGRSVIEKLGSFTLLCDYYNSNPTSLSVALDWFLSFDIFAKTSRTTPLVSTIAVLGDMLELGTQEETLHRDMAQKIISLAQHSALTHCYLYGPRMHALFLELQSRPNLKLDFKHFDSLDSLFNTLSETLTQTLSITLPQNTASASSCCAAILIKGSRGMKMEKIHERLYAHFQS
jgi:UDP-N-acetylmuramoyl-tripeptide--D-alanyl-D-alanine ligase